MDVSEQRKRRYCLVCHKFKPERCHHCSACNRCVLNMDHHCPWINNCVGFYNRKYFILLLTYTTIVSILGFMALYPGMRDIVMVTVEKGEFDYLLYTWEDLAITGIFVSDCVLIYLIITFYKFHFELVASNMTTIENLDAERSGYNPHVGDECVERSLIFSSTIWEHT